VYDVEHILLDNLQFMLSEQGGKGFDRFELQDRAISLFREFASANNVHITLVIHPRKENDSLALGVSSIFGGAKATQEADNILIIQKPNVVDETMLSQLGGGFGASMREENARLKAELDAAKSGQSTFNIHEHRRIEIKKNRFDGELGVIPFRYDRKTCRIHEINPHALSKEGASKAKSGLPPLPPPPPAAPRPPARTRPSLYEGGSRQFGGGKDTNALAVEQTNAKAAASMQPKKSKAKVKGFGEGEAAPAQAVSVTSEESPAAVVASAAAATVAPLSPLAAASASINAKVKKPRKPRMTKEATTAEKSEGSDTLLPLGVIEAEIMEIAPKRIRKVKLPQAEPGTVLPSPVELVAE
jgi:hypothetical protein